jgi:hypothetical protein
MKDEKEDAETRRRGDTGMFSGTRDKSCGDVVSEDFSYFPGNEADPLNIPVSPLLRVSASSSSP